MLPIKEEDKFSGILSKETSVANSSFRVYYGDNSVGVPFVWEAKPGTPKHPKQNFSNLDEEKSCIPPLTPPPSYYLNQPKRLPSGKKPYSNKVFHGLFPKMMHKREMSSASLSSLSSSTLSWTSTSSDSTTKSHEESQSKSRSRSMRRSMSNPGSLSDFMASVDGEEEVEEEEMRSPKSVFCFGIVGSRKISRNVKAVDHKV